MGSLEVVAFVLLVVGSVLVLRAVFSADAWIGDEAARSGPPKDEEPHIRRAA